MSTPIVVEFDFLRRSRARLQEASLGVARPHRCRTHSSCGTSRSHGGSGGGRGRDRKRSSGSRASSPRWSRSAADTSRSTRPLTLPPPPTWATRSTRDEVGRPAAHGSPLISRSISARRSHPPYARQVEEHLNSRVYDWDRTAWSLFPPWRQQYFDGMETVHACGEPSFARAASRPSS